MWFWALGWLFTALCVLGNGCVIYLIVSRRRLQTTANLFIASLAIADLSSGLAFLPPSYVSTFHYKLDLSHRGILFKVTFTLLYCSTANLCAMTADRYFAITKPLKYAVFMTRKRVKALICTAWLAPLLLFTLPAMFTYKNNETYTMVVEICRVVIFQVVPCFAFVFVTGRLIFIARQVSRQTAALVAQIRFNHPSKEVSIKLNSRAERTSSITIVILIITLFNVVHIGANYRCFCFLSQTCVWSGTPREVFNLLLIVNAAANPIAYAFLKNDIRKELFKMFKR